MRRTMLVALVVSTMLISSCTTRIDTDAGGRVVGTVTAVADGDTITVRIGGTEEQVRLIGIDTPETVHPGKPVQCWGPEASRRTKQLLPVGTKVSIARDVEARDAFGRLLAYVWRTDDGLFVNRDLVAGGWARPYPYPPNTAFEPDFEAAAFAARRDGLGLWARCQG